MSSSSDSPSPWDSAVTWVLREHEQTLLASADQQALEQWLAADPAHRAAYREATSLWLALGFLPSPGERS
ncbi:ferric-dicitrate binding protein FerR (iron transport regulator) [Herbaspirillum seropedicae]|jgi:ferric-dicitrate binding protein FerR (iron transport regulator)|uniref:FecR/PupR family sigma factor regulator n=1 Tax=Herbaspirillum seropedicae TaxID=964 RepID=UPI00339B86D2